MQSRVEVMNYICWRFKGKVDCQLINRLLLACKTFFECSRKFSVLKDKESEGTSDADSSLNNLTVIFMSFLVLLCDRGNGYSMSSRESY